MNQSLSLDHLHHALLITGSPQAALAWVRSSLGEQGIHLQGNPDLYCISEEQFLTPLLAPLQEYLTKKRVSDHRYILIACESIAPGIQNKLLKLFEEPEEGTHIILMVPDREKIIPTIQSRCEHRVYHGEVASQNEKLSGEIFLANSVSDRFLLIESWVKNKKEDQNALKSEVLALCKQLEKLLWSQYQTGVFPLEQDTETLFTDLRLAQQLISIQGMSHRLVLDYLALRCPEKIQLTGK